MLFLIFLPVYYASRKVHKQQASRNTLRRQAISDSWNDDSQDSSNSNTDDSTDNLLNEWARLDQLSRDFEESVQLPGRDSHEDDEDRMSNISADDLLEAWGKVSIDVPEEFDGADHTSNSGKLLSPV